ncbi:UDP-N-acetylmuramate:L-alanyl-gamma-D-glutamyl-meso-diaminopimelate ligase [Salmonella enterica subsp. enterica]|nr:UDP-N-acetylmuramate:L-alanyl-gamma-D-glutamyl-meso-diaminopimelate ligase [Salmonella enterica subsp. enterica]
MLARSLGHEVTGSDANVYPPMSTLLEKQGIDLIQGYDASQLDPQPDLVIIGNAMTRGNPCVEAVLEKKHSLYVWSTVAARLCVARPLGTGGRRYPRQNHDRRHGDLDTGSVRVQTGPL